jgi:hypothetical protein
MRFGDDVELWEGVEQQTLPVSTGRQSDVGERRLESRLCTVFLAILRQHEVFGLEVQPAVASRNLLLGNAEKRQVGILIQSLAKVVLRRHLQRFAPRAVLVHEDITLVVLVEAKERAGLGGIRAGRRCTLPGHDELSNWPGMRLKRGYVELWAQVGGCVVFAVHEPVFFAFV